MQEVDAPFIEVTSVEDLTERLNNGDEFDHQLLDTFYYTKDSDKSYRPYTAFILVHDDDNLYIKFFISEETIRAVYIQNQCDPVWEDSCVEFFFKTEHSEEYYNFECNAIGTFLFSKGTGRQNRQYVKEATSQIVVKTYLTTPIEHLEKYEYSIMSHLKLIESTILFLPRFQNH
jgi:hypothetical protein